MITTPEIKVRSTEYYGIPNLITHEEIHKAVHFIVRKKIIIKNCLIEIYDELLPKSRVVFGSD